MPSPSRGVGMLTQRESCLRGWRPKACHPAGMHLSPLSSGCCQWAFNSYDYASPANHRLGCLSFGVDPRAVTATCPSGRGPAHERIRSAARLLGGLLRRHGSAPAPRHVRVPPPCARADAARVRDVDAVLVQPGARVQRPGVVLGSATTRGMEFFTGYLVEWSLSMDNVFVFVVIFGYFGVPLKYQYRVLFWGILGAIVMRLTFILVASAIDRAVSTGSCISSARFWFTRASSWPRSWRRGASRSEHLLRLARRLFPRRQALMATTFLCARTAAVRHAAVSGAAGDRKHRRGVRGR